MRRTTTAILAASLGLLLMFSIAAAEAPPAGDGPQEGDILLVTTEQVVGFPVPSGATWFTLGTTGAGCKEQQWSGRIREYINNQWETVVRLKSDTSFCYNGDHIQPPLNWYASTVMLAANWQQESFQTREWGGIDEYEHSDRVIAKYKKCTLGCGVPVRVEVRKWQWGDSGTDLNDNGTN